MIDNLGRRTYGQKLLLRRRIITARTHETAAVSGIFWLPFYRVDGSGDTAVVFIYANAFR